MRGQVSLEALLVFAGVLGAVGLFWVGTEPVRQAALDQAAALSDDAAFERVRFAVRAAHVMPPGFWHEESFWLEDNVSVDWTQDALTWTSPFSVHAVHAALDATGSASLGDGGHVVSVKKEGAQVAVAFS